MWESFSFPNRQGKWDADAKRFVGCPKMYEWMEKSWNVLPLAPQTSLPLAPIGNVLLITLLRCWMVSVWLQNILALIYVRGQFIVSIGFMPRCCFPIPCSSRSFLVPGSHLCTNDSGNSFGFSSPIYWRSASLVPSALPTVPSFFSCFLPLSTGTLYSCPCPHQFQSSLHFAPH